MADIMDKAREYLAEHEDGCGNEHCIGYEARGVIEGLIKECEIAWLSLFDALERIARTYQVEVGRLTKERDAARAEVERLTEDIDTLHRECARLYEIEDEHRKCPL